MAHVMLKHEMYNQMILLDDDGLDLAKNIKHNRRQLALAKLAWSSRVALMLGGLIGPYLLASNHILLAVGCVISAFISFMFYIDAHGNVEHRFMCLQNAENQYNIARAQAQEQMLELHEKLLLQDKRIKETKHEREFNFQPLSH